MTIQDPISWDGAANDAFKGMPCFNQELINMTSAFRVLTGWPRYIYKIFPTPSVDHSHFGCLIAI
jgi:hypothetical protein